MKTLDHPNIVKLFQVTLNLLNFYKIFFLKSDFELECGFIGP